MDTGCDPCNFALRWTDVYVQALWIAGIYVFFVILGAILVKSVQLGLPVSGNLQDRLRVYQYVRLSSKEYNFIISAFHTFQCTIFAINAYESNVIPILQVVELGLTFVYGAEVLTAFLQGSFGGDWRIYKGTVIALMLDVPLICAPFVRNMAEIDGFQTWFSFNFLGSLRLKRVTSKYFQYIGLGQSESQYTRLLMQCLEKLCDLYFAAAMIGIFETVDGPYELGGPYDPSHDDERYWEWSLLGTVYYVVISVTTVGFGDYTPRSAMGRLYAVAVIISGIALFSVLMNEVLEAYYRAISGMRVIPATREIVILSGRPTMEMIDAFALEFFHPENFTESMNNDLCIVVSKESTITQIRLAMHGRSWLPFKDHIFMVKGSLMGSDTRMYAKLQDASMVYLLPNIQADNPSMNDTEVAIVYAGLRDSVAKDTRIFVMLLREENRSLLQLSETTNIIVAEQVKFTCMGKNCAGVLGFTTLICNLCKCVGEDFEKNRVTWEEEYDRGLGCEMYQVPLSPAYVGFTLADVIFDMRKRSQGNEVSMIGVNGKAGVRIHPGWHYVISEADVGAIVLASDRDCIIQATNPKDIEEKDEAPELPQVPLLENQEEKLIKDPDEESVHAMDDMFNQDDEDNTKQADADSSAPADMFAVKDTTVVKEDEGIDQWLQKLLVKAEEPIDEIAAGLSIKDTASKDTKDTDTVPSKSSSAVKEKEATKEEKKASKEDEAMPSSGSAAVPKKLPAIPAAALSPKTSVTKPPTASSEKKKTAAASSTTTTTTRTTRSRVVKPVDQGDALPPSFRGSHVLYLTNRAKRGSYSWGLEIFCRPLPRGKPFVVLAPCRPPEWDTLDGERNPKYYIKGSPLRLPDLKRAMFHTAASFVVDTEEKETKKVFGPQCAARSSSTPDSAAIFITKLLESMLGTNNRQPNVVTLLSDDEWVFYLPIGMNVTNIPSEDIMDKSKTGIKRLRDTTNNILAGLKPYYRSARFAQGNLFVGNLTIVSLAANTYFNDDLPQMVDAMTKKKFSLVDLPAEWDKSSYARVFEWLLLSRNLLAVGIYRATESLAKDVGSNSTTGLVEHSYLIASPPSSLKVKHRDKLMCLLPSMLVASRGTLVMRQTRVV